MSGKYNVPTRVVSDSFGANGQICFPAFVGRAARGNVSNPSAIQSGDILARFGGASFGTTQYQTGGSARIDFVATENHTDTSRGSAINFYNVTTGSNTIQNIATFTSAYANFTGTLVATNFTATGNVIANSISGNTITGNINFPGTITANNIHLANTVVNDGLVTSSNVQAGYIIANTSLISGAITISNNSIYSTNTAQDINFGQLAATANINFNRVSIFNKPITANAGIILNDGGLYQYNTANNSTVTQATSKSTGVTCNGRTGQITTSNAALAGGRSVTFTVTNNQVVSTKDIVMVTIASGATADTYQVVCTGVSVGSFNITISNVSASSQSDTLVINFAIIRVQ